MLLQMTHAQGFSLGCLVGWLILRQNSFLFDIFKIQLSVDGHLAVFVSYCYKVCPGSRHPIISGIAASSAYKAIYKAIRGTESFWKEISDHKAP